MFLYIKCLGQLGPKRKKILITQCNCGNQDFKAFRKIKKSSSPDNSNTNIIL